MVKRRARSRPAKGHKERLRQLAWAGLIALALQLSSLLVPVDQALRLFQYYLAKVPASGEIAFVGAQSDLTDPARPRDRENLAEIITAIDRAGAREIYVDLVFDRASAAGSDEALHNALLATHGRARLVNKGRTSLDGTPGLTTSIPSISSGVDQVGSVIWTDSIFGSAWGSYPIDFFLSHERSASATDTSQAEHHADFASRLAGLDRQASEPFSISYFFDPGSIPSLRYEYLLEQPQSLAALAGKKVVIGSASTSKNGQVNMPGLPSISTSIVDIYAAETLRARHHGELSAFETIAVALVLLVLSSLIRQKRCRHVSYAATATLIPLTAIFAAHFSTRMDGAGAALLLAIYAAFRARSNWKQSFKLVDGDTNLPTFAALEADKGISDTVPTIVVSKVHRFDEVRRTLPSDLQAEYILRIIARLKAATQDATIYLGQGNLIAWTMKEKEPALLRDHLEGLRALFASPLMVGDNPIDVGITFGVDITASPNVSRRLASAIAAAEKTNETFEPIAIADSASDEDLIWNISLQARIDAALANGEIYLVFQPKADVRTLALLGVEALVRWNDPARGLIAPDQFIRQCENAGRMGHLTRHVLTQGCRAGQELLKSCGRVPVAVNISATLLHERSIVRMVREVLTETGFDPRLLVLEITETYRIANLERAAEILSELKALGTKISMDDFGVGAASLEALMRLPFSELKIDRLFISRMASDPKALGIVKSIRQLGNDLSITVVAEGVEDDQTLQMLRDSGFEVAQGYGISRPTTLEEVVKFQKVASRSAA